MNITAFQRLNFTTDAHMQDIDRRACLARMRSEALLARLFKWHPGMVEFYVMRAKEWRDHARKPMQAVREATR